MLFFDGEGRLVEARRRPADAAPDAPAAFGWWLADWGPPRPPPPPPRLASGRHALALLPVNNTAVGSDEASVDDGSDGGAMSVNLSGGSSVSVSDQSEAGPTWCAAFEEVDSGLGSSDTSLGTAHSSALEPHPSPRPSPLSLPRRLALLRFLRVLRAPECEHTEEQLRVVEQQRVARARLDGLRADTRALLKDAKRLRAQMQECEAHAQSVSGGARRLSEELRETRHLDSVLRWLRGPLPDVALAALPDDATPARAQGSAPHAGTPAGAFTPGVHQGSIPLRRYRSEGDIPTLRHSRDTKTLSGSVPPNYHLLSNDFEETYLNVEPQSPSSRGSTNIRHVFLSTDYETPYLDVEPRISSYRSCHSLSDPSDSQWENRKRKVDSCEEGLRLITGQDKDAYKNLQGHNQEDDDDLRTEDEWSLLSYGSEESLDERRNTNMASSSAPTAYIDLRPAVFRHQSLDRFLDVRSSPSGAQSPHHGPRAVRSRSSLEEAVSARFRGRGFTVAESLPEGDDSSSSSRASTPTLSRGYSV